MDESYYLMRKKWRLSLLEVGSTIIEWGTGKSTELRWSVDAMMDATDWDFEEFVTCFVSREMWGD